MSRTRSTRASSSTAPVTDADPEFLALTTRQQRQIDRVFDRATRHANNGPPKKKRRLTPPIDVGGGGFEDDGEGEGGFMDAGGFDPDDGGGFISDEGGGGGGFMDEDIEEEPIRQASATNITSAEDEPRRIPLRNLPAALSSLNLPSDEDVLAVFRASASGWTEQTGRYRDKDEEEENRLMGGGVELKDFRAVCAALTGPDEGGDHDQVSDDEEGEGDMYQDEDGESSLSEITENEYNEPTPITTTTGKGKGKGKGKGTGNGRGKKKVELEDNGKIKLNSRQREVVNDLWGMLKPDSGKEVRGGHILGRDEVRRKVRDLGEMWTEDEITEMVTLFSSQYQGRGLSYDDFGAVMVRAGLA